MIVFNSTEGHFGLSEATEGSAHLGNIPFAISMHHFPIWMSLSAQAHTASPAKVTKSTTIAAWYYYVQDK